ncbi:hypothetical protein Scep_011117 [Stephania cephalantha]|uniref:Exostosin GT47 domain-containing protein n=1 Tax=Stephania cephalantha TaxID=152367 RepID=A0AAP0P653_9MAGN
MKTTTTPIVIRYSSICSIFFVSLWFLILLVFLFRIQTSSSSSSSILLLLYSSSSDPDPPAAPTSSCHIPNASVYVYQLPPKFNAGLLRDCRHLNVYTDMCPHVANRGLGQPLPEMGPSWFATHQFIAEMIFHARMENHPCRVLHPHDATLFYVPFYGGLHASSNFRQPDLAARDRLALDLADYLTGQPWWGRRGGRDHFLALGRTAWDFMRRDDDDDPAADFGANCLLNLAPIKNMSVLSVERHPWEGHNQRGIPYPSYFHPLRRDELVTWQNRMRRISRPHLFSFAGAPRSGVEKAAIRDEIIRQCGESRRCRLLKCGRSGATECHNPSTIIHQVMSRSHFCLQAPGDSFTRRSTFDSVLAGCIPVFFSPHTAYTQYQWYLPPDRSDYSVYMDHDDEDKTVINIEEELLKIPEEKVEMMRRRVIALIPTLTYLHPNSTNSAAAGEGPVLWDAVDVALQHLSSNSSPPLYD